MDCGQRLLRGRDNTKAKKCKGELKEKQKIMRYELITNYIYIINAEQRETEKFTNAELLSRQGFGDYEG